MPTPHNSASKGDFAKTILMPGDPLRSQYIAENFLKDAKLVNNVRGVQGYTGTYKGVRVSVMASGMGMPSIGIYSHELFHEYDVENIIRVGSAGALTKKLKLRDVVLAQCACTDSHFSHQFGLGGILAPAADFTLLETAVNVTRASGAGWAVGSVLSSDIFYNKAGDSLKWADYGVLAVEMESAALYWNAAEAGRRALTICTISDSIATGEALPAEERQTSFTQMMEIALDTAVEMEKQ